MRPALSSLGPRTCGWRQHISTLQGQERLLSTLAHGRLLYVLTSTVLKAYPTWNYGVIHVAISLGTAAFALNFLDEPLRTASRRWFLNNGRHSLSQVRLSDQTRGSATL